MADAEADVAQNRHIYIDSEGAAVAARRTARDIAAAGGFDSIAAEEIAIAVSELAHNIVRHAQTGHIALTRVQRGDGTGLQIDACDRGAGIADPRAALSDGFSSSGGLGLGLGAVNRLMDEFEILPPAPQSPGAHIRCVRWQHRPAAGTTVPWLDTGIISRPKPGQRVNGDAYLLIGDGRTCTVAVIDGVGHGPAAHQAAATLCHYLETHTREPLEPLMAGASRACLSGRGAVMALARLYRTEGTLEHTGVGNIETRLLSHGAPVALTTRRGILGFAQPGLHINRQPWHPGDVLVLFSDGLRAAWNWEQFPAARLAPAQQLARDLFDTRARDDDDATVLVVKYPNA